MYASRFFEIGEKRDVGICALGNTQFELLQPAKKYGSPSVTVCPRAVPSWLAHVGPVTVPANWLPIAEKSPFTSVGVGTATNGELSPTTFRLP